MIVWCFLRSLSQHGRQGVPRELPCPKASQSDAPEMHFLLFWDHAFTFFGDTLEYFLFSMNNKLVVLDVEFTVVFA